MINVIDALEDFPTISLQAGTDLIEQGGSTDSIYFLLEGEVVIIRDKIEIASSSAKGSMFGEMSVILGQDHSATVRCVSDSKFFQVDQPHKFMDSHPEVIWHITQTLCQRIANLNRYLIDMKHHYDEETYIRIADDALKELMK